jgi:gliding motility-associated-like protein
MNIKSLLLSSVLLCFGLSSKAQVSMTGASGNYSQDFNTLANAGAPVVWADNTNIANWYSQRTGTGNTIVVGTGSVNTGALYSFGVAGTNPLTERALGSIGTGNAAAGSFAHGVLLQNNTGSALTSLIVTYTGEQWRNSAVAAAQPITFYYQISSSAITSLTPSVNTGWTAVPSLDFAAPIVGGTAGALDGNVPANRATLSVSIPAIALNAGEYIMLKWEDPDHAPGNDHGLAIDDVSIDWSSAPPCTPPLSAPTLFTSSNITNTTADISWTAGSSGNVIVVAHQGVVVNSDPVSGVSYTANATFGSGTQIGSGNYVVYNGTGTSVSVTGLAVGTTYHFSVYEYDPNGGSPCYLLTDLPGNITTTGAPATCFEIESILVNSCGGTQEGENEMVRFKVGSSPVNVADLTVTWPNNPYLGICQDATTAAGVATLNASILACGFIKEPTAGILPAGAEVILVTSVTFTPSALSFANLNDTIYMIFQCAGNTAGHFVNQDGNSSATETRSLIMSFSSPVSCSDAVVYTPDFLTMQNGNVGNQDGGAVEYTAGGVATYINRGCQAPFIPLTVSAGNDVSGCFNAPINITGTGSAQYSSLVWSGGTGTFSPNNSYSTTYTPGAGETSGTVELYLQLNSNCSTFVRDTVVVTLNPAPTPTITSTNASATICNGGSITLSAAGGTSYVWSTTATTNTVTVSPATSTVYTVDVVNACSTTQGTFSVTVNDLPVVAASNTGAYCVRDSIHLSATSGFSYAWTGPNTFSSSSQNPFIANATAAMAGTYSLTVTDAATTCQNSTTTTVVVNALPVLISSVPPVIITPADCGLTNGAISGASATGANPVSYEWISSSGIVIGATTDISGLASGVYYLAATDGNGCRDSVSFTITTLNGPATPTFAAVSPVCEGGSFTLTVTNPIVGATYNWVSAGNPTQSGVDLTSITINSASATNVGPYTVEVVDAGCGSFGNASVTLNTNPIPAITGSTSFCFGTNTVLDASSSLPSTGTSYQWYFNNAPISGETSATLTATQAGDYQVLVTNTGCDSLSAETAITINALPVVNTSTNPVVITNAGCGLTNASVIGANASGNAPFTYAWTNGAGTVLVSDTALLNVGAGTYYLVALDNNGCIDSASVTLTAAPAPAAPLFDAAPSVCEGSTFSLSVSNDLAGASYSWVATGLPTQTGVDLTSITVSDASSVSVGTYTVSVTVDNCVTTGTVSATFNPRPLPQITNNAAAFCTGDSLVLVANPSTGVSYQWLFNNGNITGAVNDSLYASQVGDYSVYVLDANGCDSTSSLLTVGVHPEPVISSSNAQFCLNSATASLTATSANPNIVYSWNNGAGTGSVFSLNSTIAGVTTYTVVGVDENGCDDTTTAVATILANPTFGFTPNDFCVGVAGTLSADNSALTYTWANSTSSTTGISVAVPATVVSSTTYSVTGTDANSCTTVNTITAIVHASPVVEILNQINGDTTVCGSTPIDLLASGATTYVWSTSAITNPISVSSAGSYSVVGTDAFGCVNSTTIDVTAAPGPVIGPGYGVPTICNGYQTQLSIDSTAGYTYSWVNSLGTVLSTDTIVTIATAGNYTLTVTNSCGSTSQAITIGSASIDVSFDADTTLGLAPLHVQFTNTSSGATNYYWLFGNGDTLSTTTLNPVADLHQHFDEAGTYVVYLLGTNNSNYCSASATMEIIVLAQDIGIVIPNVFSPNGDAINDYFGVQSYGIKQFSCSIYNRWGTLITELDNVSERWTPGSNASEGTYFYLIKATGIDNKDYSKEGYLLLVR